MIAKHRMLRVLSDQNQRAGTRKRGQVQFVRSTLRAVPANWTCPLFRDAALTCQRVVGTTDDRAAGSHGFEQHAAGVRPVLWCSRLGCLWCSRPGCPCSRRDACTTRDDHRHLAPIEAETFPEHVGRHDLKQSGRQTGIGQEAPHPVGRTARTQFDPAAVQPGALGRVDPDVAEGRLQHSFEQANGPRCVGTIEHADDGNAPCARENRCSTMASPTGRGRPAAGCTCI